MEPGDAQLVRCVLDGHRSAYGGLYDRYACWVRAVCYDTTRSVSEAQDLTQDVFLRAYVGLGQLHDPERFAAWLHSITRNRCLEWLRTRSRSRHDPLPPEDEFPEAGGFDGGQDDEEIRRLREALLALPDRERLAIHSHYLLNHSAEQARSILNLSRAGWYRLLRRARDRLGRIMKRQTEHTR